MRKSLTLFVLVLLALPSCSGDDGAANDDGASGSPVDQAASDEGAGSEPPVTEPAEDEDEGVADVTGAWEARHLLVESTPPDVVPPDQRDLQRRYGFEIGECATGFSSPFDRMSPITDPERCVGSVSVQHGDDDVIRNMPLLETATGFEFGVTNVEECVNADTGEVALEDGATSEAVTTLVVEGDDDGDVTAMSGEREFVMELDPGCGPVDPSLGMQSTIAVTLRRA